MEQNVSMKINELPSPTWNWLKVNETPIKWSNKIEPCEIAAEGDAVATETEQLSDIETGAGREADAIFATENTANAPPTSSIISGRFGNTEPQYLQRF